MTESERGFTLIELLISIGLLVLLMTMLFAGLNLATHHLGRETERLERTGRTVTAQQFLRTQLADARPLPLSGSTTGNITFLGRANGVNFVGAMPEAAAVGGLQMLSVAAVEDRGNAAIELRATWQPFGAAAAAAVAPSHGTVLLDHIKEAEFAYFGVTDPNQDPSWHTSWEDMSYLPALVRISIMFDDGESMPDLVVALRASLGAAGQSPGQGTNR
jgi:general secretion pathway protein J